MTILLLGVISFIVFMMIVMGRPLAYFLKRDMKWQSAKQKTSDLWHN